MIAHSPAPVETVPTDYVPSEPAAEADCRAQRCTYYLHYLIYGPADLPHRAYHEAERLCAQAQRMVRRWMDEHETGDVPRHLLHHAERWERAVRA